MPRVKSISSIAEKWARVTPARAADYRTGVENPTNDWAEEAIKAEDRYVRGVTEAANAGRYGKGVSSAGTAKWKHGASKKGPSRFAEGVAIARPDYEKGFAPFRDTIESTDLPPRGPKGDPANISRVTAIASALHARKIGG